DSSVPESANEAKIDKSIRLAIELGNSEYRDEECITCLLLKCSQKEFEQLHYIADPTPGKAKGAIRYTIPFSSSSIHAKNIGITVLLESFFNTILYTCGMLFHNTCDLASTKSINSVEIKDKSNNHQSDSHNNDQPSNDRQNDNQLSDDLPSNDTATDNMIARYKPYIESIDICDEKDINNINSKKDIYDDINNEEEDINDINEEENINEERDINKEKDINEGKNINKEKDINKEAINNEKSNVRSDKTSIEDPIYKLF
ncbi:230_t:CDS:2, partial [Gigaspora margarita]